ncbi:MAG: aminotransferase DegT [Candidatus Margulisiibacteriota bacterium]|nr:MAG: aminotransferase DegT [Candidatus Margulisiibacteriota bacterium]
MDNQKIDFVNLKAQYLDYKEEIDTAIHSILDSASFIQGHEVRELEESLARYLQTKHCITCSSGTDALLLALLAIGIKPGDEVITTAFSFFATAEAIALLGATPVFVDIDEKTYNIDATQIEAKITSNTKAIIPVNIFGQPADIDEINKIATKHKLIVIEDGAQSFGARYKNKKSCCLSEIGCTSFFPAKPLGCYGDGGALFTDNDELAGKLRCLMNHGQAERYEHKHVGINGRLDTIQAAILRVKLKYYDQELKKRKDIALRYTAGFSNKTDIVIPFIKEDRSSTYAQYSIRLKNRNEVVKQLQEAQIPVAIHYPIPLYRQAALSYLAIDCYDFPISETVSQEILSLPISPYLSLDQQDYIIATLTNILRKGSL